MKKVSAGLLMYRKKDNRLEFFLVHPGGPYYKNKDEGIWSIPKGLTEKEEELLETAIREFKEETGITPEGPYISLGSIKQKSGKVVYGWAFEGDLEDPISIKSNYFEMEWPPKSGHIRRFPEIDKAGFFPIEIAEKKIIPQQILFLTRLKTYLDSG